MGFYIMCDKEIWEHMQETASYSYLGEISQ